MPFVTLLIRLLLALAVGVAMLASLAGCSSADIPGVYRIDIQQGNVVTQDMLNQLEPGMDQRKVRFVLGTPMLTDTFNNDRWDYIYSYQEGGGERVQRRVSVYFENGTLSRVDGDVRRGQSRTPVVARNETIVTVPPTTKSEGFFSALKPGFFKRDKKPRRAIEETATPAEPAAETQAGAAPEAAVESQAAAAPEAAAETASAAATASPAPPAPTAEDQAYLESLFRGFGTPAASGGETAGGRPAAVSADDAPAVADTDADVTADESAEAKPSYLKRLLERLREAGTPDDAPANEAGPVVPRETAAP